MLDPTGLEPVQLRKWIKGRGGSLYWVGETGEPGDDSLTP